ncbi:MAG TPA: ABC transporter ATP-binding protein [Ignavibacteria bacterium]|nr:ABC transporter ATP-binding protein [Ignavibacteria bacterium]
MKIELVNLKKKYLPDFELIVEKIDFNSGETIGLVGNNGAGKTTMFKILLDLININTGNININGQSILVNDDWKSNLGAFISTDYLIPYLTPLEYFKFVGTLSGIDNNSIRRKLNYFRNFLSNDIFNLKKKLIRDFSEGNQVKIGIVATLLPEPDIIILDEPFFGLDPSSQIVLKAILNKLSQENSKIIIISSHDLQHVSEICSRVIILEDGRIVDDKKTGPDTLFELTKYFMKKGRLTD